MCVYVWASRLLGGYTLIVLGLLAAALELGLVGGSLLALLGQRSGVALVGVIR